MSSQPGDPAPGVSPTLRAPAWPEQRQQAEKAIRAAEDRYRILVEQALLGIYIFQDDRFVYVNPKMEAIFGWSSAELTSRPVLDLIAVEDRLLAQENIRKRLEGTVPDIHYQLRMLHHDGRVLHVEVHGRRAEYNGRPAIIGGLLDLTERKQAQEAIVGYNERLRILHQIDLALIAGEDPQTIAAAALPLLRDLLGVGRVIVNLFDLAKGEVEWLAAAGRRRVRGGAGVRYSIRFMGDVEALRRGEHQVLDVHALPPGKEVDALLASGVSSYVVVPMIAAGELIGALSFGGASRPISAEQIGIVREVATQMAIALVQAQLRERVKRQAQELEVRVRERTRELEAAHAELQLTNAELAKRTTELQAANKELEAFSFSVSHDLRAPLRAITGFARILLEDHAGQLPEPAREHLHDVQDAARQMEQLVDDLLNFARLSRQAMKMQVIAPEKLVWQCLEDLRDEQQDRHLEIVISKLERCRGDPSLLKQVWINILSNALKYTRNKDPARIELGCLKEEGQPQAPVTYFVRDNGVGFDMRYAPRLFGVFQRLHRAEDFEGTGVGLAIVQRIIHRHGGRVWAEGRLGEGATFYFSLPPEDPGP